MAFCIIFLHENYSLLAIYAVKVFPCLYFELYFVPIC